MAKQEKKTAPKLKAVLDTPFIHVLLSDLEHLTVSVSAVKNHILLSHENSNEIIELESKKKRTSEEERKVNTFYTTIAKDLAINSDIRELKKQYDTVLLGGENPSYITILKNCYDYITDEYIESLSATKVKEMVQEIFLSIAEQKETPVL